MDHKYEAPIIFQHLPQKTIAFLSDIFAKSELNGKVTISCSKDKETFQTLQVASLPDLPIFLQAMFFCPEFDYFISLNESQNGRHELRSLFAMRNMILEFTPKKKNADSETLALERKNILNLLHERFFIFQAIPEPTAIIVIGDRFQLLWNFEPKSASGFRKEFDILRDYWMESIEEVLEDSNLSFFRINHGVSKADAGLLRIPGTYDTESGSLILLKRYQKTNHYQLHFWYNEVPRIFLQTHNKGSQNPLKPERGQKVGLARMEMLKSLREIRNAPAGQESQELLCHLFFNAARMAGYNRDAAYKRLVDFNSGFREPLSEGALRQATCPAASGKFYWYSNATIIQRLQMTDDEQIRTGFSLPTTERVKMNQNQKRDNRRREMKDLRNERILDLHRRGYSVSAISRLTGNSRNTIARVIKENPPPKITDNSGVKPCSKTEGHILYLLRILSIVTYSKYKVDNRYNTMAWNTSVLKAIR